MRSSSRAANMKMASTTVVLAASAVLLSACGGGDNTPEGVVKSYYAAFADEDFAGACDLLAPQVEIDGDCESLMKELKTDPDAPSQEVLEGIEVTDTRISEEEGKGEVTITSGDESHEVDVRKIDGQWKLAEIG